MMHGTRAANSFLKKLFLRVWRSHTELSSICRWSSSLLSPPSSFGARTLFPRAIPRADDASSLSSSRRRRYPHHPPRVVQRLPPPRRFASSLSSSVSSAHLSAPYDECALSIPIALIGDDRSRVSTADTLFDTDPLIADTRDRSAGDVSQ